MIGPARPSDSAVNDTDEVYDSPRLISATTTADLDYLDWKEGLGRLLLEARWRGADVVGFGFCEWATIRALLAAEDDIATRFISDPELRPRGSHRGRCGASWLDAMVPALWHLIPLHRSAADWLGHLTAASSLHHRSPFERLATLYLQVRQSSLLAPLCWARSADNQLTEDRESEFPEGPDRLQLAAEWIESLGRSDVEPPQLETRPTILRSVRWKGHKLPVADAAWYATVHQVPFTLITPPGDHLICLPRRIDPFDIKLIELTHGSSLHLQRRTDTEWRLTR